MSYGGIDCKMWLSNILCKIYYISALFFVGGQQRFDSSLKVSDQNASAENESSLSARAGGGAAMFTALHRRPPKDPIQRPETPEVVELSCKIQKVRRTLMCCRFQPRSHLS